MILLFTLVLLALWLVVALAAVWVTRAFAWGAPARGVVWRLALCTTLGMLAANAGLAALLMRGLGALGPLALPTTVGEGGLQLLLALGAIGGPLLASVLGWLLGAAVGGWLALQHWRGQRGAP